MTTRLRIALLLFPAIFFTTVIHAQQTTAAQFIASAASLINGSKSVSNIEIEGSVTRTSGSLNESGTIRMQADTTGRTRVDTTLGTNLREEYYSGFGEAPGCIWADQSGQHSMAQHNCHLGGVFFAPLLLATSYESGTGFKLSLSGDDQGNGIVTVSKVLADATPDATSLVENATKAQLVFDKATFLPSAYRYAIHPDADARVNIPVEIRFSNYQSTNGIKFPFHIKRFVNGMPELDITVTNVVINSDLTISK